MNNDDHHHLQPDLSSDSNQTQGPCCQVLPLRAYGTYVSAPAEQQQRTHASDDVSGGLKHLLQQGGVLHSPSAQQGSITSRQATPPETRGQR